MRAPNPLEMGPDEYMARVQEFAREYKCLGCLEPCRNARHPELGYNRDLPDCRCCVQLRAEEVAEDERTDEWLVGLA